MVTFRSIFDAELSYVWGALRRLGVPERDREDLVHDVFVVVHRKLAEFDTSRPLRPWLFGIAYRRAADYRRLSRHRHEVHEEFDEPAAGVPSAEEALVAHEAQALLARALDRVDHDRRAVLILHDLEGWPMADIAASFDIPVRTGYSRLRVGREELAAAVRRLQSKTSRTEA